MSSEAIRDPDVVLRGGHELVIQRPFGLVLENCRRMERDDLIVLDREVMARALEVRHLMREAISMHSEMHSEMLSGKWTCMKKPVSRHSEMHSKMHSEMHSGHEPA